MLFLNQAKPVEEDTQSERKKRKEVKEDVQSEMGRTEVSQGTKRSTKQVEIEKREDAILTFLSRSQRALTPGEQQKKKLFYWSSRSLTSSQTRVHHPCGMSG